MASERTINLYRISIHEFVCWIVARSVLDVTQYLGARLTGEPKAADVSIERVHESDEEVLVFSDPPTEPVGNLWDSYLEAIPSDGATRPLAHCTRDVGTGALSSVILLAEGEELPG